MRSKLRETRTAATSRVYPNPSYQLGGPEEVVKGSIVLSGVNFNGSAHPGDVVRSIHID